MSDPLDGSRRDARPDDVAFLRRTLIVAAISVLALFLWMVRGALLLAFAAVIVAVLITAVAAILSRRLHVPSRWSVAAACVSIAVLLVPVVLLVRSELQEQAATLLSRLPQAISAFEERFGVEIPTLGGGGAAQGKGATPEPSTVGAVAQRAASAAVLVLDALGALVLAIVGGVFIAADPATYRRGLVRLLPRSQRDRVQDALVASGHALRLWLQAQLVAMAMVGILVGLGAWAIGLPAPLALGLIAALADFVPLIGPFIGAVPGVLLAAGLGWEMTLWTVALYLAVQQIEGNLLTPLLGERMVSIPPALLLFSVVAAGAALGTGGVLLAAPLTVVAVVLVSKLYVTETLGEPVAAPGEKSP